MEGTSPEPADRGLLLGGEGVGGSCQVPWLQGWARTGASRARLRVCWSRKPGSMKEEVWLRTHKQAPAVCPHSLQTFWSPVNSLFSRSLPA